jgi:hypothetical protein
LEEEGLVIVFRAGRRETGGWSIDAGRAASTTEKVATRLVVIVVVVREEDEDEDEDEEVAAIAGVKDTDDEEERRTGWAEDDDEDDEDDNEEEISTGWGLEGVEEDAEGVVRNDTGTESRLFFCASMALMESREWEPVGRALSFPVAVAVAPDRGGHTKMGFIYALQRSRSEIGWMDGWTELRIEDGRMDWTVWVTRKN